MITYLEIIEQPDTIEETPQTIRLKVMDKNEAMEGTAEITENLRS